MFLAIPACDPPPRESVTLKFDVEGMHCKGCVEAIDTEVREVEGVRGVRVSLEEHCAVVETDGASRTAAIESAIRSLGYTVRPIPES